MKLLGLLAQEGVIPLGEEREAFNPAQHEAITREDNPDYEDGEVIGVVQKGYRMGERILRPAQVRVAKHS